MTENPLQLATKNWIEAVHKYYEREPDRNEITKVFMRGYFAGWSEREIAQLADNLAKNETDYPFWRDQITIARDVMAQDKDILSRLAKENL